MLIVNAVATRTLTSHDFVDRLPGSAYAGNRIPSPDWVPLSSAAKDKTAQTRRARLAGIDDAIEMNLALLPKTFHILEWISVRTSSNMQ